VSLRPLIAVLCLAWLAACAAPPPPPRVAAPPPMLDPDSACLRELRDRHVVFEQQAAMQPGACSVPNPVKVANDGHLGLSAPALMSCSMARTLERFEAQVVAPVATRYLGQKVVRLIHMGTYACRTRRTESASATNPPGTNPPGTNPPGTAAGGRPSEHAKGQAIDVGGFELADGTVISVKKDWFTQGKRADFLHEVARASCEHFNVVLTPNHNRLHHDHLHLDIGPHKLCGV
jgi:hypothetical protein